MNYPTSSSNYNTRVPSPPKKRPELHFDPYHDDYNYPSSQSNTVPRRPVRSPPLNTTPRGQSKQDSYGTSPPNGGSKGRERTFSWSRTSQEITSDYTEPRSTLVYPEDIVHKRVSPPSRHTYESDYPQSDLYGGQYFGLPQEAHRPLPTPPRHPSPYPPTLHVSPYEQQYPKEHPNDQFYSQHYTKDPFPDPFENPPRRDSPLTLGNHIEMPTPQNYPPLIDTSDDIARPLPPTPKSSSHTYVTSSDPKPNISRSGSGNRPGTRSSTSSMYSYTPERQIEHDYFEDVGVDYPPAKSRIRSDSFTRRGTVLEVRRSSGSGLRIETDDLDAHATTPTPPPHVEFIAPSRPESRTRAHSSFSPSHPIYRSLTEPRGHHRTASNDPVAPPPPPKIPLTDDAPRPSLGVLRSQSSSAAVKPHTRPPSYHAQFSDSFLVPEETPLSPVVEGAPFPLSSKTFQRCEEPWSLSALKIWVQEIFGSSVSMETVSIALQGLFTHHVSTLSTLQADKLAAQVGTTWLREGVLFEPTVANTALWNPLSTLEMSFTPYPCQGVIPKLTGKGCYSSQCANTPPGVGRCYSHCCSRTLAKKSRLPAVPTGPQGKVTSDWSVFWNLDAEFLRTLGKTEVKRQNVIFEFIQAEEEYVSDLNTMLTLFKQQLIVASSSPTPIIPAIKLTTFVQVVFGNVKPILEWQTKSLLIPLRERQAHQGPAVRGVGDIVLEWVRGCREIYADYAGGYPFADSRVREETAGNPAFATWLDQMQADPVCRRLSFNSFLQAPNRKIQRVLLLFGEIIKNTEETNRDRETLQKAMDELKSIVHECDARIAETTASLMREELDKKFKFKADEMVDLGLKEATRKVLHRGDVIRKSANKLEWLDIHLILLDNYLIMTKKKRERDGERLLVSKMPIPVDLLQLEGVTGDAVSKAGRFVGTMTTTVSIEQPPVATRVKTSKSISKVNSPEGGDASPDLTLVTSLTNPPIDQNLIYPFSITHLSSSGDTYTLYADSVQARQTWVDRIMEARIERAALMSKVEPFQAKIVAEGIFGVSSAWDQSQQRIPALVELSTMHRALSALRAEPFGGRSLGPTITNSRVNCAKSFIAPENTDYAHQRLVAVGTDDGVYIGYLPELSGLCTTWAKVLNLSQTTQIDVLDEFGVFLVLANKELIAYSLSSMIPVIPQGNGVVQAHPMSKQPQRLSGNHSVGFFATGKLKDRMLVMYKKKGGVNSVFKALEPVVGKSDTSRRNLFSRKKPQTEFFRELDEFFIAAECFGLFTFKSTIAIPTPKGFEVLSLDSKDAPHTIPDLSDAHLANLATQIEGARPIGMYRITDNEFLLCYDRCAIYVDKHGELSRSKAINWHGKPRATQVIEGKYVLAFDTSFIEIWRCDSDFREGGVNLVQIIPGRDVRMIGKEEKKADLGLGPGTGYFDRVYVAMGHPERTDRQVVVELVARM